MKPRFQRRKEDPVYVARESFTFERDGESVTVSRGTRLAGDQPPVQAFPSLFGPDAETPPPRDAGEPGPRREPASVDARTEVPLQPIRLARLKRTLRVGVGDDGTGKPTTIAELPAGTLVSPDAELVRLYPDEFELPE